MSIAPEGYRVLARKYRPASFKALIGQEAMVRTLGNAIDSGRLAHAFLLTGVRGVGKTSTARLIAKALNCVGVDGSGGPTMSPCDVCDNCISIAQSRHMDVMEMDAASRTGVDDVREIIDAVRYAPVSARYKIYIIDEVHMLSKNAFNALLKTLEEPPPHVKFLFATTEIRKVPITVLSRCQRFDLKRISTDMLVAHFKFICDEESVSIDADSLALIARAAEGSVRDGLSMLDQAIAHGGGTVQALMVRDMLGLADRGRVLDLMGAILLADATAALDNVRDQYDRGADPATLLSDLLELTHSITRARVAGTLPDAAEAERSKMTAWATQLSMPALQRLWQILSKGLGEVQNSPSAIEAAEMVILRLIYAADLPDPADLLKKLANGEAVAVGARAPAASATVHAHPTAQKIKTAQPLPASYEALIALLEHNQQGLLGMHLRDSCVPQNFAPPQLDLGILPHAPRTLAADLKQALYLITGESWTIAVQSAPTGETLRAKEDRARAALHERIKRDPLVVAALHLFPGASIDLDSIKHQNPNNETSHGS
jgi:DNA polymerase III subunit gamma/tau